MLTPKAVIKYIESVNIHDIISCAEDLSWVFIELEV
jgi:hypothetical protein